MYCIQYFYSRNMCRRSITNRVVYRLGLYLFHFLVYLKYSANHLPKHESSLPLLQVPANRPYPEPDQCITCPPLHFLNIHPNITLPSRLGLPSGLFPSGVPTKTLHAHAHTHTHTKTYIYIYTYTYIATNVHYTFHGSKI